MNFLGRIFKLKNKLNPKSLSGHVHLTVNILIIRKFRQLAIANNCAPSVKMSDQTILFIYDKVVSAFNQVAESKDEKIPAVNINSIVFKFIQVYEMTGETFFEEHLKYEIDKYKSEGLRPDYLQQEIRLV